MDYLPLASTVVEYSSVIGAAAASLIALAALVSGRSTQTRQSLGELLAYYDEAGFHTLIWRMEQLTRGKGQPSWSLAPITTAEVLARHPEGDPRHAIFARGLATDWSVDRAGMHDVHFFALRLHAWLTADRLASKQRRIWLLNDTFGYQLLSTMLDHEITALRLRRPDQPESYFATQYGLFGEAYRELLNLIADDLLSHRRPLVDEIRKVLRTKRERVERRLAELSPEDSAMVARAEASRVPAQG